MTRIETTTYAESVISTPNIGFSASRWPITNGMTYIVRPVMQPAYSPRMRSFISPGSIQLLVGPASFSSTRADVGAVLDAGDVGGVGAAQNELGLVAGSSRVKVPVATSESVSSVHSSSEPVHQWIRSGVVIAGDLGDEVEDALVGGRSGLRVALGGGPSLRVGSHLLLCPSVRRDGHPAPVIRGESEIGHRSVLRRGEREVVVRHRPASLSPDVWRGRYPCQES